MKNPWIGNGEQAREVFLAMEEQCGESVIRCQPGMPGRAGTPGDYAET